MYFCSSFLTVDKDQKVRLNKRSLGAAVQESHAHSPSKAWSLPALGVIGGLVLLTAAVLMCVKSSRLVCPCVSLPLIILFLFSLSFIQSKRAAPPTKCKYNCYLFSPQLIS